MDPMEPQQWMAMQQQMLQQQEQIAQMAAQIQLLQQQPMAAEQVIVPVAVPAAQEDGDDIDAKRLRQFLKFNARKFNPYTKQDPEDWLYGIEVLLKAAQITEDARKLEVVPHILEVKASNWWRSINEGAGVIPVATFERFKEDLIRRYRPQDPVHVARQKLDNLKQTGSASNYADQFSQLDMRIKLAEGEKQHRFIKG